MPTVFIDTQSKIKNSIYNTEDSYTATVIHEFAHIYCRSYWDEFRTNKLKTISFLEGKSKIGEIEPPPLYLEEVFAFCVECEISKILFPQHAKNMDNSNKVYLNRFIEQERHRGDKQVSILVNDDANHIIAMVLG